MNAFRRWAVVLAILAAGGAATAASQEPRPTRPPNILLLFADDMRPDAAGALGSAFIRTPNLDRLASRGIVMAGAHIMGGLQGAVCVPSRAMMLSGRSLFTVDERLRDTPTWPMRLRDAGYATHATGKWHNGPPAAAVSFPGAGPLFLGGMVKTQFEVPIVQLGPDGKPSPPRTENRHSSEVFADEAVRFLGEPARQQQPWALYVAFTAPHDPRDAPRSFHDRYPPDRIPLPPNFLPEHPFDNGELKIRDELLEAFPRTPEAIRKHLSDYAAIVTHLDAQVGRILEALERSGQAGNTLVVFAADNGLAIGSHGLMGKQNVYEHSVGVPMIVRGPGIPAGSRSSALCYLNDLSATFCELAGAAPLEHSIGRSLLPVLRGQKPTHREELLFAYRHLMRGVRYDRWKAIWYPPLDRWQLFDLQADPHETRDLAADPAHAAQLDRLRSRLEARRAEFGDTARLGPPSSR